MIQNAMKIKGELAQGSTAYPFKEITPVNIGNPHLLGQAPITFYRQVQSILMYPALIKSDLFPEGVKKRAQFYLDNIPGGIGAYTQAQGYPFVRQRLAQAIERRDDGVKASADHIQMADGSADAVLDVLSAHISDEKSGIMIPCPQYPLYSGGVVYLGGAEVPYYPDEDKNWEVSREHLDQQLKDAQAKGINVRGLVVINPGNPTSQIYDLDAMRVIIKFCYDNGISLLADEVYQDNTYTKKWYSFKYAVSTMDAPYNQQPLYSFQSASKGYYGECGLRGAYVEFLNIDPQVEAQIKKITTLNLSINTVGQIAMDLIMNPPTEEAEGKEVYELFCKERDDICAVMKKNSELALKYFNDMKNVDCKPSEGSVYSFPRIKFSDKVIQEAEKEGVSPDLFYTLQGLKETGMVFVEGTGFRQKPGSYHFRTTVFVRPPEKFEEKLQQYKKFNDTFHEKYA